MDSICQHCIAVFYRQDTNFSGLGRNSLKNIPLQISYLRVFRQRFSNFLQKSLSPKINNCTYQTCAFSPVVK
ncbi:MAG: hypothetical protein WCJ07_07155, partial [Verrucomicrobiota bacterium]